MTEQQIEEILSKKLAAELPRLKKKWFLFGLGLALCLPLAIYAANITKPHIFADGDTLSATKLNENFDALYTKINALDSKIERQLGTYCGQSASASGGSMGGITGVRALCAAACGSNNAHMCTSHEISTTLHQGLTVPVDLWYSSVARPDVGGTPNTDCEAWTDNSGTRMGSAMHTTTVNAGAAYLCNTSRKVACCL